MLSALICSATKRFALLLLCIGAFLPGLSSFVLLCRSRSFRHADAYRHVVAAPGVVTGDEARFGQPLPDDEFRLHAVGADFRHRKPVGLALSGGAVAVHTERDLSGKDVLPVSLHICLQPRQLLFIAAVRDIEHVTARHETERMDRVRLFLCRKFQGE